MNMQHDSRHRGTPREKDSRMSGVRRLNTTYFLGVDSQGLSSTPVVIETKPAKKPITVPPKIRFSHKMKSEKL